MKAGETRADDIRMQRDVVWKTARAVRGVSCHILETLAAHDARTVQSDAKQFGRVVQRLESLLKKDLENQGGKAAVAQKLAEFQRDPKAWLAANLNPSLGERTPKGYEAFSNATVDWRVWIPPQTRAPAAKGAEAAAQGESKAARPALKIPRVSKPWREAFRLVGDGSALYSDFTLIRDKRERWHCIGTFGKAGSEAKSGHAPSDGYALFHAVGNSLESPMTLQDKIPYQIASTQAHMWAPGAIWNRDRTTAFLFYFHYLGSSDFQENCVRLLTSNSPELATWHPYAGTELQEKNMVFRERDDRDFCVFWDDRMGVYLMYYACAGTYGGLSGLHTIVRVRTSRDLLHWSEPTTVMGPPPGDYQCAESPFVLYREGYYYLWVSGIDYSRLSLYVSEDPFNFGDPAANRIEEQPGHAPEIVSDNGRDYMACSMVSSVPSTSPGAHDLNGVLIQPLHWDAPEPSVEKRVTRRR